MPVANQMLRLDGLLMVGLLCAVGPEVLSFITCLPTVWPRSDSM